MALENIDFIDSFRSNTNYFVIMETAISISFSTNLFISLSSENGLINSSPPNFCDKSPDFKEMISDVQAKLSDRGFGRTIEGK